MKKIRAVVWDMGGVILRTEDRGPRERLGTRFGLTYDEINNLVFNSKSAMLAGIGDIDEAAHWLEIMRILDLSTEELALFQNEFWAGDKSDKELLTFINALRPDHATGLLSNAWSGARKILAEKYQCLQVFDYALFSAEAGCAKPDHKFYCLLLEKMRIEPGEAVFVDDMEENVQAARTLGMIGIKFTTTTQTCTDVSLTLKSQL